jgi:hypothetical protein
MTHRVSVHDITERQFGTVGDVLAGQPSDANQLTAEEHVASARALEAANQPAAAVQSWHRASVAFSKRGEHDQVSHCIRHAEQLAGNRDFSASLERKNAAADAVDPDGEVFGDNDEDQPQPKTAASAPDPADGERYGDEQTESTFAEG